jgi:tetratricopeptide (TPR) repeat protein
MQKTTSLVCALIFAACTSRNNADLEARIQSLDLQRGDVTLCGGSENRLGTVAFAAGCSPGVEADFNLATSLLHSFEYPEAEKVFARVMANDPDCVMAYWGAAMSIFHPLWEPPKPDELSKGERVIALGREVAGDNTGREADYLEAIATIYDDWQSQNHLARLAKFEKAAQNIFERYPDDPEAAIFYALALRAASDPADKSYVKQKKAGEILETVQKENPNHPGIVHYLIHVYDYPELAEQGLAAARSYAEVAAASAHAQHMPSHIFIRLGLWPEAIQSNLNSVSSAQCYAQSEGIKGHWDEELHGMDYLIYAYLQRGDDQSAMAQLDSLEHIGKVFPTTGKVAYSVAAMKARYALERRDWNAAANLELPALDIDWKRYPWEKSNHTFARLLGAVNTRQFKQANDELQQLQAAHASLNEAKDAYKSNLVMIQAKAGEAWIRLAEGKKSEAIQLMTESAELEDKTEKHSVTPGELLPARELLGDMYVTLGQYDKASAAYQENLRRHPNRFNGLLGAAIASEKAGRKQVADEYYQQLMTVADPNSQRALAVRKKDLVARR